MTAKEFFKSVTFKCIITLLCVLLVSGIFLTVMNSLLKVTDEEKFARAISKIYGKNVSTEAVAVADYNDNATINEAYKVKDDGNYLVKATGKGGFDNGTVTCWVVVVVKNGAVAGIDKVVIDSNKGQSYIGNINDKFLNGFKETYVSGEYFNPNQNLIKTGATRSANAICNAVNGSIDFVNAIFGNVTENVYENCVYTEYVDTRNTSHSVAEGKISYSIATKGYGNAGEFKINILVNGEGAIESFAIAEDGNGSTAGYGSSMKPEILDGTFFTGLKLADLVALLGEGMEFPSGSAINTGATQSNYLCVYAAAFATANYGALLDADSNAEEGGEDNE